jgi:uncharacterized protein (DUF302 family)
MAHGHGKDQGNTLMDRFMLMSRLVVSVLLAFLAVSSPLMAAELVTKESPHSVGETLDRLEALLDQKGIGVMARIDHAANAERVGLELAPSQLLLFGDPAKCTLLMQEEAVIGIDLPMKALAWEDEDGVVWLAYVVPSSIADERGVTGVPDTVSAMDAGLNTLTDAVIAP